MRSGIVKTPAKHPLRLDHAGPEGDAQADLVGHGGPDGRACAYPAEHRPYWAERIGHPLGHGAFGESFSTGVLLESEVVVGDVCRLGVPGRGAVVQVSQPRTPSYKLAARHGVKELAAWVAEAGITGFYLRLVDPGEVRPGDPLALLGRPAHGVTVLETNRVMYRDRHDETTRPASNAYSRYPSVRPVAGDLRGAARRGLPKADREAVGTGRSVTPPARSAVDAPPDRRWSGTGSYAGYSRVGVGSPPAATRESPGATSARRSLRLMT